MAGLLAAGLLAGGAAYWHGLDTTTLTRQPSSESVTFLLYVSVQWIGVVALLAGLGAVTAFTARQGRPFAVLTCVLAAAVLLVPIEQARIHTYTSMFKHVDYGAWFGSAAAGYASRRWLGWCRGRRRCPPSGGAGRCLAAVLPAVPMATARYGWPDTSTAMPGCVPIVAGTQGRSWLTTASPC